MALPKFGGELADNMLVPLRKDGGELDDDELVALPKFSGELADNKLVALIKGGGALEDDELVALTKFGGEFEATLRSEVFALFRCERLRLDESEASGLVSRGKSNLVVRFSLTDCVTPSLGFCELVRVTRFDELLMVRFYLVVENID